MIEMSSVFKKKRKKIPPAFLHEGIFVTPRPYLNDIAFLRVVMIFYGSL